MMIRIVYGMMNDEPMERLKRGEMQLRGSVIFPNYPKMAL